MNKNIKIVVPSIRGGLLASCCGECHKVQVRTGICAEEYIRVFKYYWTKSLNDLEVVDPPPSLGYTVSSLSILL